jgi:hypothetical protein
MPSAARGSVLIRRSFRNQSSKDMALPHPQSRQDHYRKEDKPGCGGVAGKLFKRTIDITQYRNAKDDVNPAKNRALGRITDHDCLRQCAWCIVFRSARFTIFAPPEAASWAFRCRTAGRTLHSISASRTSSPRLQRCGRGERRSGGDREHRNRCATRQHPSR